MSYMALYRKFRPDQFDEVKGQEHIVTTLKNQLMADRIGHAYLFCGTRGTGKTTVAKLFAKAVNCDVAFVPIGGIYTMNAKEAASLINTIEPQIAIPTHYGEIIGSHDDAVLFKKLVKESIEVKIYF